MRTCWIKAIAGAWCTTVRMHDSIQWPCIYGCQDARDEFLHYLYCPALWSFARESLGIQEDSIGIAERLCFVSPSPDRLRMLAFVHLLYHATKNGPGCVRANGCVQPANVVQYRCSQLARSVLHMVAS